MFPEEKASPELLRVCDELYAIRFVKLTTEHIPRLKEALIRLVIVQSVVAPHREHLTEPAVSGEPVEGQVEVVGFQFLALLQALVESVAVKVEDRHIITPFIKRHLFRDGVAYMLYPGRAEGGYIYRRVLVYRGEVYLDYVYPRLLRGRVLTEVFLG